MTFYEDDGKEWVPPVASSGTLLPTAPGIADPANVLVSTNVAPLAAFEVFSGKVLFPPTSSHGRPPPLPPSSAAPVQESSLSKYARLTQEVDELVSSLRQASSSPYPKAGGDPAAGAELLRLASALEARVKGEVAGMVDANRGPESVAALAAAVSKAVGEAKSGAGAGDASAAGGACAAVTYELYSSSSLSSSGAGADSSSLESRLSSLERVVYSPTTSASVSPAPPPSSRPLLQRLSSAEAILSRLDRSAVDSLAATARLLRDDLAAASRSREKLASSSSSRAPAAVGAVGASPDGADVRALLERFAALQGVSSQLPNITSRLRTLQGLHAEAGGFAARLAEVEGEVRGAALTVGACEQALMDMEKGLVENLSTLENNVKKIESRVALVMEKK